jgi:hypothetical protein
MDLISGTPLWPTSDGLPAVYPRLHHDLRCDLAVIGGLEAPVAPNHFKQRGHARKHAPFAA